MKRPGNNVDESAVEILQVMKRVAAYECQKHVSAIVLGEVEAIDEDNLSIMLSDGTKLSGNNVILSDRCMARTINIPYDDDNTHIHDEDEMLDTLTISYVPHPTYPGKLSVTSGSGISLDKAPVPPTGMSYTAKLKHKHKIHPALKSIKLWRGLEPGDIVVLLRLGDGRFFALERSSFETDSGDPCNTIYNPKLEDEGDKDNPDKEK